MKMSYGRYSTFGSSYLSDSSRSYRSQIASPSSFDSTSTLSSSYRSSSHLTGFSSSSSSASSSYLTSTKDKGYLGRSTKHSDLGTSFVGKYTPSSYSSTYTPTRSSTSLDYKTTTNSSLDSLSSGYSNSYLSRSSGLRESSYLPSSRSQLTSPGFDSSSYSSSSLSRAPYRSSSREFGASYSLQSSSLLTSHHSTSATPGGSLSTKGSSYNLTPFESRRTTHTPDYQHLNSFRHASSSATATASSSSSSSPPILPGKRKDLTASHHSVDDNTSTKELISSSIKERSSRRLSESSDSFDESVGPKDPDFQYLTNRATSPLEVDELKCCNSIFDASKYKNRNRLLSRKKTKAYPVSDKRRKRQLKNALIQVDNIDLDFCSGRITASQASAARTSLAPKPQTAEQIKHQKLKEAPSPPKSTSPVSVSPQDSPQSSTPMPKQSGFIPKQRKSFDPPHDSSSSNIAQSNDKPLWRKNLIEKVKLQQQNETPQQDATPKQSSFSGRQWKNKLNQSSLIISKECDSSSSSNQTTGLTLKESLEKVRKWKKQLAETQSRIQQTEAADEEESIFGKDEWKKKNIIRGNCSTAAQQAEVEEPLKEQKNVEKTEKSKNEGVSRRKSKDTPPKEASKSNLKSATSSLATNVAAFPEEQPTKTLKSPPTLNISEEIEERRPPKTLNMLPDLIRSSEEKLLKAKSKKAGFIGKFIDIDSLLGCGGSDEEVGEPVKNKQPTNGLKSSETTNFEKVLTDLKLGLSNLDSDELLPDHFLPEDFLKLMTTSDNQSLADSESPTFDFSSCQNILDAPVPTTPDVPLFPIQVFEYPRSESTLNECKMNVKTDYLKDLEVMFGLNGVTSTGDKAMKSQEASSEENATEDEVDAALKKNTSKSSKQMFQNRKLSTPSDRLIDIDSDEADVNHRRPKTKVYPDGYSDTAINKVLNFHKNSGRVPMEAIIKICRKTQVNIKDETRKMEQFRVLDEGLDYLGVDVKKLEDCCLALHSRGIIENFIKVPAFPLVKGSTSEEVQHQFLIHKITLRAKVAALLEKIKISNIPTLEIILYSLKNVVKGSEEFLRNFLDLKGVQLLLELVSTFSLNSRKNVVCITHCLDKLLLRALLQMIISPSSMRILSRDEQLIRWLLSNLFNKNSLDVTSSTMVIMILMMGCSNITSSIIFKIVMEFSKKQGVHLWSQLITILKREVKSQDTATNLKDLDLNCMQFINTFLKTLPDVDSSLDFSDRLEDLDFEKHVQLRSYTTQSKVLQDLFANYEDVLKEIDTSESHSDANKIIMNEGFIQKKPSRNPNRKSRRFEKWCGNNKPSSDKIIPNKTEIRKDEKLHQVSKKNVNLKVQDKKIETSVKLDEDVCFSGLLEKAKTSLNAGIADNRKSKVSRDEEKESKAKSPERDEVELKWEQALAKPVGSLKVKEMDFTDLTEVDELNYLDSQPSGGSAPGFRGGLSNLKPLPCKTEWFGQQPTQGKGGTPLLPPPPMGVPPPPSLGGLPPPTPPGCPPMPPPPLFSNLPPLPSFSSSSSLGNNQSQNKHPGETSRRTLRLYWKEARGEFYTPSGRSMETIWGRVAREVGVVKIDKKKFEELFETKTLDVKIKKSDSSKKELSVLDSKRSNAINIALTSLPPVAAIKIAILKMDTTVLNREDIEKILNTMLPTAEEVTRISEVQLNQVTEASLGTAEMFLMILSSISELKSRLRLWLFMLEFDALEMELASHLLDLKLSMQQLKSCPTFKYVLLNLLAIGNCLNNNKTQGFTIDYLGKVSEVKDAARKHSLLHHLVDMVIDHHGSEVTDLFSEMDAVHRCSKVDWEELNDKMEKLEATCKSSWDDLRRISMHENNPVNRNKLSEMLADFAERIMLLKTVHQKLVRRFRNLLLYLGYQAQAIHDVKVNSMFKIISDFSAEFKLTRDKILKHRHKKEAKELKSLQQQRIQTAKNLSSKSEVRIESHDEMSDIEMMVSSWFDADFKLPNKSSSLGRLGSSYASENETGDEELMDAVCRSASRPSSRNKKRMLMGGDRSLHSSWKESLANRDRSIY